VRNANTHGEIITDKIICKMDILSFIKENKLKVIVRPNSFRTELIGYNENDKAVKVAVKAAPEKGRANQELVNFISKLIGKRVIVVKGLKSRKKTLFIISA
jgi:hypothetical protein